MAEDFLQVLKAHSPTVLVNSCINIYKWCKLVFQRDFNLSVSMYFFGLYQSAADPVRGEKPVCSHIFALPVSLYSTKWLLAKYISDVRTVQTYQVI